nr:universal stress protein [Methanocella sp. CWC-04]
MVPVDGSEQSFGAINVAGVIASSCNARVTLFHVRKPPESVVTDIITEDKLFSLPLIEKESEMFERCMEMLGKFNIKPSMKVVESDDIAGQIIYEYNSANYDAIIIGHRGRTMLKQLVLGSVANAVLVEAQCPVIMVHVPRKQD